MFYLAVRPLQFTNDVIVNFGKKSDANDVIGH